MVKSKAMITINLKIAMRRLAAQKLNSAFHVIGLTLGIGVCLMITLFIRHELSFDAYHQDYERIYRVNSVWKDGERTNYTFSTPLPMAEVLRAQGTAFEKVVLAHPQGDVVVEAGPGNKFLEQRILIASPEFADVFSLHHVSGNLQETLHKPYHALLTESSARKLFGSEHALGKVFKYKNEFDVTVGGVIKNIPSNSHLKADIVMSYVPNEHYLGAGFTHWGMVSGTSTFFVLREGASIESVQKQLSALADQYINSDPNLPKHVSAAYQVQPLRDIHFEPEYGNGGPWGGAINTSWLWIFGSIGLAVLFLACINFVNLSTAQALTRCREVGVRKSVGAAKAQLILQFLSEAWLLSLVAGIFAMMIVQLFLPALNTLLEKEVRFEIFESVPMVLSVFAGVVIVGALAGMYPAWVSARFNPALALKGKGSAGTSGAQWLRPGLVVTQFGISGALLIAVMLISDQVHFLRNKNLGYDKENVVTVPILRGQGERLASQLEEVAQIKDFSFGSGTPTASTHWGSIMTRTDGEDANRYNLALLLTDHRFAPMYALELVSGRFHLPSDTNYIARGLPEQERVMKCVVNETLVRTLGFSTNEEAVGEKFWFGMNSGNAEIVGVVKDFNTSSLHQHITPVAMFPMPDGYGQLGIKIQAGSDLPATLAQIRRRWEKAYPDGIFEYAFLDQQIDDFYKAETRLHKVFQIFAGLAMLISCLGLWGLASFATQQRTKEIGIRKILGASVRSVVVLLSAEFILMVVIALALGFPLAYYLMNNWLANFAFHIDIGAMVFVTAGLMCIVIALVTVGFQALRVAGSNPSESLRTE
jgi:putative ABC transport system permease protein